MQLTWFSVELTAWAQSFQSSSVAVTTMSTVLEEEETRQQESPARRVSRASRTLCFRIHPQKFIHHQSPSGAGPGSGRAAGAGDSLPGGPPPPPADLCQRGELPVLFCGQDELALRAPAAAPLLLPDHEPRSVRFPTKSIQRELDVASVSQVEGMTCFSLSLSLSGKNCLSVYYSWDVVVAPVAFNGYGGGGAPGH